jgi:hypothetical protein
VAGWAIAFGARVLCGAVTVIPGGWGGGCVNSG